MADEATTAIAETEAQDAQAQEAHSPEVTSEQDSNFLRSMFIGEKIEAPITTEEEILEPDAWLEREFGTKDVAALKAEREELKTLREKTKSFDALSKYDLSNEDKLYEFLSNKKSLEKLSKADLSDKGLAAELVKFNMQKDNPNLDKDDVDFLYNKRFSIPDEPTYDELNEVEDDFKARHKIWEQTKSNIERELVIEAKLAQPKIAQLSNELVLPEIQKPQQQPQVSQKDLDDFSRMQEASIQSAEKQISAFEGFKTNVKEKDFNYVVGYTPSTEEKTLVGDKIKQFVENGFDANAILKERWSNADGKTLNVEQMVKDLSRLYAGENADKKLATDSANKRLEAYLKEKKQINVNQTQQRGTFNPQSEKTKTDKLTEALLGI